MIRKCVRKDFIKTYFGVGKKFTKNELTTILTLASRIIYKLSTIARQCDIERRCLRRKLKKIRECIPANNDQIRIRKKKVCCTLNNIMDQWYNIIIIFYYIPIIIFFELLYKLTYYFTGKLHGRPKGVCRSHVDVKFQWSTAVLEKQSKMWNFTGFLIGNCTLSFM
jgi:hypothetical protein